jgi:hypothetical protein
VRRTLSTFANLFFCGLIFGQTFSTVNAGGSDPSRALVPSAKIIALEVDTSLARSALTNADGLYVLSFLRPTRYTLAATKTGSSSAGQRSGITLVAE